MRGKLLEDIILPLKTGITPADAGKTLSSFQKTMKYQDHPRGCGENMTAPQVTGWVVGSPPRMRGKLGVTKIRIGRRRITPADAGKTSTFLLVWQGEKDHPRGCGEN